MTHVAFSRRTIVIAPIFWVIVGFVVTSVSCGGSNGGLGPIVPVNQSPAGIWRGPFTSTINGALHQADGLVSEDHDAQFLVSTISERHYSGNVSVVGDVLTGTLVVYLGREGPFLGFDGLQSITLDGTAAERDGLFGDYTGAEDEGRFNLNYSGIYEGGSSLGSVAGVWIYTEAFPGGALYTVTLDIDVNGAIFGGDTDGCIYSGQVGIIDDRFNSYRATFNISSCIRKVGDYSGLMYLSSIGSGQQNQMTIGVSKANRAFAARLQKL